MSKALEHDLIDQLVEALQALPAVKVRETIHQPQKGHPDRGRPDAELDLVVAGSDISLVVEVKRSVYPRDVREMVWQLRRYAEHGRKQLPHQQVLLIAAQLLSPGAKQLLEEEHVGYFDSGGSLSVPAPGAYIYVDKPPPKIHAKSVRALFRGKRAQLLHALLHHRNDWFGVGAIAELAQVSTTTASETLTELERFEWVIARGQGPAKERRLENPKALLDAWARQVESGREPASRRYYVPGGKSDVLMDHIAEICAARHVDCVFTQEAAAQRYAPFLTNVSRVACRLAPGRAAEEVVAELGARVVAEGANLAVIETPTDGEFLFKVRIGKAWLASPVQVYLDLLQAGGRAKEMADHLRKERIGF